MEPLNLFTMVYGIYNEQRTVKAKLRISDRIYLSLF